MVTSDGMAFSVEEPQGGGSRSPRKIVEVDVSEEVEDQKVEEFAERPFVVFVLGGPGCGKGTQCERLREEFNLVHLSTGDLLREEVAAGTKLGMEIEEVQKKGKLVS